MAKNIGREVSEIVDLIKEDLTAEASKKGISFAEAKEKLKANLQSIMTREVEDEVGEETLDFYSGAAKVQTILSSVTSDFDERVNDALSSGWRIGEVFYNQEKLIAVMYKIKGS